MKGSENKKETLVDLIVPVYYNKETLLRLFASVALQTMRENIKIILVQDCDGENYAELLDVFCKILNIDIIVMQQNCGPGTCRRVGMQRGNSKYIMFMDADDTFHNPFAVEELLNFIEKNNLDAANSIFLEEMEDKKFVPHSNNDWVWVFGKIYRRSYLEDNEIYFNDSRANEDSGFNTVVCEHGKVEMLHDITYIWMFKENSITRVDEGIYRFTGLEGWLYNMEWAIKKLIKLNLDKEKIQQIIAKIICVSYCWYLELKDDEDKRVDVNKFVEWVEKFAINVYNEYIPTEKQLLDGYKINSNNKILMEKIPTITLKDFIKMVGGESAKE